MKRLVLFAITAALAASVLAAPETVANVLARPQVICGNVPLHESVYGYYYNEIVRADLAADAAWMALKTPGEIKARGRRLREEMVAAIGGFPARCPLNVTCTGKVKRDGYVIEKIYFESRPKHYVSAHLFVPDDPKFKAPYPGVISPCGHSRSGKLAPWYQRPGVIGAKNGFVVLVYDPIDQGERHQMRPTTNTLWSTTDEHNRIGLRATLLGWNTAQFRIWDGMRAVDVLDERPDVDHTKKTGVMGISGGGTLSSYIMALEDRIGAAAPAGYLMAMRNLCNLCGPQDAEQNIFGQLKFGLNHLGYVLMRAPSPVMMNCTHQDFFHFGGSLETYALAQKAYAVLGASEQVTLFDIPGPHHWFESEQQASFGWMKRWLNGEKGAYPADLAAWKRLDAGFSYEKVDVATANLKNPQWRMTDEGAVTPDGYTINLPGARTVYELMQDEFAAAKASRPALTPEAVRATIGLPATASLAAIACDVVTGEADGVPYRAATLVTPENLRIPTVAFLPKAVTGTPALLVTDTNRVTLAARVQALVKAGRPVMVAELRAFGETGRLRAAKPWGFYGCRDEDEEVAMMCCWLGRTLVGDRVGDLLRAAREFAALVGGAKPEIVAEGRAAVPAAHAFYVERGRFAGLTLARAPISWTELLANPAEPYRFANVVHKALRLYDWTDLAKGE